MFEAEVHCLFFQMYSTIFVTGGTGLLGGHFLRLGNGHRWRLRCLARKPPPSIAGRVEWIQGVLPKIAPWEAALRGCDAVVHLACASLPECEEDPVLGAEVNVAGFRNLFDAAAQHGVRRFILASSAEAYGLTDRLPVRETTPLRPRSLYGFTKACADLYALERAKLSGLSVCILRFFSLYGCSADRVCPPIFLRVMAERVLCGQPVVLHASLRNSRDFLHVTDAARALWLAVERAHVEGVINIGSGHETPLREAARRLAKLAGRPLTVDFRPGEGRHRRLAADCRLARRRLGFIPKVSLDQGLREMLEMVRLQIAQDSDARRARK